MNADERRTVTGLLRKARNFTRHAWPRSRTERKDRAVIARHITPGVVQSDIGVLVHIVFQACFHTVIGIMRNAVVGDSQTFSEQQSVIVNLVPGIASSIIEMLNYLFTGLPDDFEGSCEFDIITKDENIFSRVDAFGIVPSRSLVWLFELKSTTNTNRGRTEYEGTCASIQDAIDNPIPIENMMEMTPLCGAFWQMIPAATQAVRGSIRSLEIVDAAVMMVVCVCALPEQELRYAVCCVTIDSLPFLELILKWIESENI